mmetsp:Transcript_20416/g.48654  ORF Transcript_20416/g.48654 Transcript_20416/m.48654 type:complete len:349 (-) Transcript_20416:31-1077(-)
MGAVQPPQADRAARALREAAVGVVEAAALGQSLVHRALEGIAHRHHAGKARVGRGLAEEGSVQVGRHAGEAGVVERRLAARGAGVDDGSAIDAAQVVLGDPVRLDHVGPRPGLLQVDPGGGAGVRVGGDPVSRLAAGGPQAGGQAGRQAAEQLGLGVGLRLALVDETLELVRVGVEGRQVGVLAHAGRQGRVAQFLQHHHIPALRGDVLAQLPVAVGQVQEVGAQRGGVAGGQRHLVVQPRLIGHLLEDGGHAAPGVGLEAAPIGRPGRVAVGAARVDGIEAGRQVMHRRRVVVQHRVDAAEGIAVADEEHPHRLGGPGRGREAGEACEGGGQGQGDAEFHRRAGRGG